MYISVDESQMGVSFLDCFRFCMNDIEYEKGEELGYIKKKPTLARVC